MITSPEPEFSHPRVRTSQRTGCDPLPGDRSLHSRPDAYGSFVENTTQEAQNDFYGKLARILLKNTRTAPGV